jgi:hypothetical protein
MINLDQPQIQQNINTEIHLTSDHGTWNPVGQTTQPTTFTIAGTGGSIISEYILDRYNAIVTVLGTTAGTLLTVTDTVNGEAVSVSVQSAAGIASEESSDGDSVPADQNPPGDNQPPPAIDVPVL